MGSINLITLILSPYVTAHTLEGAAQLIPGGPAASVTAQQIICEDGGGFFNVNDGHPFTTPTGLDYWLQMGIILLILSSLIFAFGEFINNRKIAWAIFGAAIVLSLVSTPFFSILSSRAIQYLKSWALPEA